MHLEQCKEREKVCRETVPDELQQNRHVSQIIIIAIVKSVDRYIFLRASEPRLTGTIDLERQNIEGENRAGKTCQLQGVRALPLHQNG